VIVRHALAELPAVLAEAGIGRPYTVAGARWAAVGVPGEVGRWTEVPSTGVPVPAGADGIVGIGGGSAIDTAKHASATAELPVVHVPTTYSGAEWTTFYGIRSPDRRIRGGGAGARPVGIVYDVDLTLDLPPDVTAGTALNALAHCAEALYVRDRSDEADDAALRGAARIARSLPAVLAEPRDRSARSDLLEGAADAGFALGRAGLGLAHAMAQAVGGAYGLPHGAMNALCLPPALEFNRRFAGPAIARFGDAIGGDAVERTRELAQLGGFERLRDFGVPRTDLAAVAAQAAGRAGNRANPRPATAEEIEQLYAAIW